MGVASIEKLIAMKKSPPLSNPRSAHEALYSLPSHISPWRMYTMQMMYYLYLAWCVFLLDGSFFWGLHGYCRHWPIAVQFHFCSILRNLLFHPLPCQAILSLFTLPFLSKFFSFSQFQPNRIVMEQKVKTSIDDYILLLSFRYLLPTLSPKFFSGFIVLKH